MQPCTQRNTSSALDLPVQDVIRQDLGSSSLLPGKSGNILALKDESNTEFWLLT